MPPGQLAERLRKAQQGSTKHTSLVDQNDAQSASRKSILRSAGSGSGSLPHNIRANKRRASTSAAAKLGLQSIQAEGTWSPRSSQSSHPSGSTRSSVGDLASGASSANDDDLMENRSNTVLEEEMYANFSGRISPTSTIVSRSTSNRRPRVLSEDASGLGMSFVRSAKHNAELDERFRQWNAGLPFQSTKGTPASTLNAHPFPSSHSTSGRLSSLASSFASTPELSSEEEDRTTAVCSPPPIHQTRTSSMKSTNTVSPATQGAHKPPQRRVSFNQNQQVRRGDNVTYTQTIGRAQGRSLSNVGDKRSTWHSHLTARAAHETRQSSHGISVRSFPTTHPNAEVRAHAHSHVRGKRMPSYSAPTSPRTAFRSLHANQEAHSRTNTARPALDKEKNQPEQSSVAELAILSSLGAAQAQFASARSIAGALTRQLSAPLRPMLHLTLLVSISSMAFVALSAFLVAGYLFTVWDDVNSRRHSITQNVSSATKGLGNGVQWTRRMLSGVDVDQAQEPASQDHKSSAQDVPPRAPRAHNRTAKMLMAPLRFAIGVPVAVIYNLTPKPVREVFSSTGQTSKQTPHSRSQSDPRFHQMPPRPPLSSLLPSIALTVVIALGAGLASFFAERAPTSTSRSPGSRPSSPLLNGAQASPLHGSAPRHARTSSVPSHIRRRSHLASADKRSSYSFAAPASAL